LEHRLAILLVDELVFELEVSSVVSLDDELEVSLVVWLEHPLEIWLVDELVFELGVSSVVSLEVSLVV
jgi:hypothetical protein